MHFCQRRLSWWIYILLSRNFHKLSGPFIFLSEGLDDVKPPSGLSTSTENSGMCFRTCLKVVLLSPIGQSYDAQKRLVFCFLLQISFLVFFDSSSDVVNKENVWISEVLKSSISASKIVRGVVYCPRPSQLFCAKDSNSSAARTVRSRTVLSFSVVLRQSRCSSDFFTTRT